jgi:hypothetical protein
MLKVCTNCHGEYFARWRNEPTTLCPECRSDVVLCAACRAMIQAPIDAAQLALWPGFVIRRRKLELGDREPHFSHGRVATQAERRRSPYH